MADDAAKFPLSNVAQRVITAAVVGPLVVIAVLAGGLSFTLVVTASRVVGILEFYMLAHDRLSQGSALVGVPTLILVVLAFHIGQPVAFVAGAGARRGCDFLSGNAAPPDRHVRRSLVQVGMTLVGVLVSRLPQRFSGGAARAAEWRSVDSADPVRDLGNGHLRLYWRQAVGQNQARAETFAQKDGRRRASSA